jgi:hypothetical protein
MFRSLVLVVSQRRANTIWLRNYYLNTSMYLCCYFYVSVRRCCHYYTRNNIMEIPCVVWCCQYMEGGDVYKVRTVRVVLSELRCVSLHYFCRIKFLALLIRVLETHA